MMEGEQQMMLGRDVNWKKNFNLLVPRWRCVVVKDGTGELRDEGLRLLPWATVDALKFEMRFKSADDQTLLDLPLKASTRHRR